MLEGIKGGALPVVELYYNDWLVALWLQRPIGSVLDYDATIAGSNLTAAADYILADGSNNIF